ncbi:MAG: glycerophosphoryl diester phosphodiesterase [Actinomycetota bacterium]|jgi:glycerophosphoryl diester phosphodiesterase
MTLVFGHRGASAVERENTIAAFETAARLGADGVELDVRRTADSAMAIHHDATLADGRVIVEVPALALPSDVPTLRDALVACAPMHVNIEIKNVPIDPDYDPTEALAANVVSLVQQMGVGARVIVSSFGLAAIDAVRALDPSIATGWLTLASYDQLRALDTVVEHGHSALHPFFTTVTSELVTAAHAAGVAVNTWTVDDADEMRRLAALGVDALITNDVALAVATLR